MRIRSTRAAALVILVVVVGTGLDALGGLSAHAATYTFAYNGASLVAKATVTTGTGKPVSVTAGSSITIYNNSTGTVTITGPLVAHPPQGERTTIAAKAVGTFVVPPPAPQQTTVSFTADEPGIPGTTQATGTMTVIPPPSAGSGGGAPVGGGSTGAPAPGPPAPGGGSHASDGGSYVGPGLPGGVIAPVSPGASDYPDGPAPLVAPYQTATAPSPESSAPDVASTSPAPAAASARPGDGSSDRSLGLPAAITAVLLIGVAAALARVFLTDPEVRALPRRH